MVFFLYPNDFLPLFWLKKSTIHPTKSSLCMLNWFCWWHPQYLSVLDLQWLTCDIWRSTSHFGEQRTYRPLRILFCQSEGIDIIVHMFFLLPFPVLLKHSHYVYSMCLVASDWPSQKPHMFIFLIFLLCVPQASSNLFLNLSTRLPVHTSWKIEVNYYFSS